MQPRIKVLAIAVAVLALAGGLAWTVYYLREGRYWQSTNDATIQADQVTISARLAGNVGAVLVSDNQTVAAGTPLVAIDPVDYQIRLAGAQAGVASARAGDATTTAALAEARAGIETAQADLAAARTAADHAAAEVARYRPLVEKGAESAQELAGLVTERDRAVAALAARKAALDAARRRAEGLAAQIGDAHARIESAVAQQRSAARDLSLTRMVAPVAGRVAARSVRQGQYVQPGTRLLTIVPDDDLYVIANFKETQVGLMRPGQAARVHVDALPGVVFNGRVASLTPGTGAQFSLIPPQNATGNFTKIVQRVPVKILLNPGPAARRVLAPGMSVTVDVDTRAAKQELDAIAREQDNSRP